MQFISSHIEFLWIIPVVAFGFFIFLIQYFAVKREERNDLSKEVALFNTGSHAVKVNGSEHGVDRLNQLERAISTVTDSLSAQQRTIEQFHKDNTTHNEEVSSLKSKLRELYKEYDIILSENYSLKAKVKKMKHVDGEGGETSEPEAQQNQLNPQIPPPSLMSKVDMKLYEDTRTLNLSNLDDFEADLSDFDIPPKG